MVNTINNGGPAFPSEGEGFGNPKYHAEGMSLREWYAGKALSRMADFSNGSSVDPYGVANAAVDYADAMIAALKARESL